MTLTIHRCQTHGYFAIVADGIRRGPDRCARFRGICDWRHWLDNPVSPHPARASGGR